MELCEKPKNPATALKGIETWVEDQARHFSCEAKNPATALKGIETLWQMNGSKPHADKEPSDSPERD